jgi:subtilase-type serine protease
MNHPLYGRSSRSLSHRPLALAVASSLLLATALPAMASESLDAWQQQRQLQAAWAQPAASTAPATTATAAAAAAPPFSAIPAIPPAGAAMNSTPIGAWVRWAPTTPMRAA